MALAALLAAAPAPGSACGAAVMLAIDVSSSVDAEEYRLQTEGHALAFRDPEIVDAILAGGGVMVSVTHWSGSPHQELREPWRLLDDRDSIAAFADRLERLPRRYAEFATALGSALRYFETLWTAETEACARRIIDISGDGVNNSGYPVGPPRDRLIAAGVTLNALVITGAEPPPEPFYRTEVIGGPGAFLQVANGFQDYAEAFRRKLLREVRLDLAAAAP